MNYLFICVGCWRTPKRNKLVFHRVGRVCCLQSVLPGNHIGAQDTAGDTGILAGAAGLYCGENYQTGVLGTKSGYLYPAADS